MGKFVVTFKYGGSLFQGVQDHPAFDYVNEGVAEAVYNCLVAYHGAYTTANIELVSIARHSNSDGGGQTVYNTKRIEPRAVSWELTRA